MTVRTTSQECKWWAWDGQQLREIREARGFSRPQLGTRLGVRADTIRGYERGDYVPNAEKLAQLCNVLGVQPTELFTETTRSR